MVRPGASSVKEVEWEGMGLDPCGLIKGQVAGSYEHSDDLLCL